MLFMLVLSTLSNVSIQRQWGDVASHQCNDAQMQLCIKRQLVIEPLLPQFLLIAEQTLAGDT